MAKKAVRKSTAKTKKKAGGRAGARNKKQSQAANPSVRGALGVLVLGIGLLLLACLIIPSNAVLLIFVRREIQGIMGKLGIFFPLLICWAGLLLAFSARNRVRLSSIALLAVLVLCTATLFQVAQYNRLMLELLNESKPQNYQNFMWKSYQASTSVSLGGGALGALIAYPLARTMDVWGSSLLLLFVISADLVLLFQVSMPKVGERMGHWAQGTMGSVKERVRLDREERARLRAERLEEQARLDQASLDEEADLLDGEDDFDEELYEDEDDVPSDAPVLEIPPLQPPKPKVLYIEDVVAARNAIDPKRTRRGRGELPSYLEPQKARFSVYDRVPGERAPVEQIPLAAKAAPPHEEAEPLPPWEPLVTQEQQEAVQPPVELEPEDVAAEEESTETEEIYAEAPVVPSPPRIVRSPLDWVPEPDPATRLDRPIYTPLPTVEVNTPIMESEPSYRMPPFQLLDQPKQDARQDYREQDMANAQKLEETLQSFGVTAHVLHVTHGPAITRYELQPAPGVKVSRIVSLTDDIALNMAAAGVRIEAPIPGKAAVGVEIPNDKISMVLLREVLEGEEIQRNNSKLAIALGKDIAGKHIIADISRMPHVLIAGATGSGKSVCINAIITSIIYRASPAEVRLILIDPKQVELAVYDGIPHLLVPVVTNPKKAAGALNWAVMEMTDRYKRFADRGVRDIRGFNARLTEGEAMMTQIVVVIDELADLMMEAPGEVESAICRIAQLARAAGIHLVIATQRPSVNVITGLIKGNIPSRMAFAVASQIDARTILDNAGAEKLLGKGDMLYAPSGGGKPVRVQCCFVSDEEVARVVDYVKDRHTVEYNEAVIEMLSHDGNDAPEDEDTNDNDSDELLRMAVEMAIESGQTSISMLQRRLRIGYARAGRLVDDMSRRNIIGPADGSKPRPVLITAEDFRKMFP